MVLRTLLLAALVAASAAAHGGTAAPESAADPALPFPVQVDARFSLTDHFGHAVTEADYAGKAMLIFFGYADCQSICSVALPTMAEALNQLGPDSGALVPLMITVDPAHDTPDAMREKLGFLHPDLIGLTGPEPALAEARARFGVESELLFVGPDGLPVYAHGSFLYLIGPDGALLSLLPPILDPARIAALIRDHLGLGAGG